MKNNEKNQMIAEAYNNYLYYCAEKSLMDLINSLKDSIKPVPQKPELKPMSIVLNEGQVINGEVSSKKEILSFLATNGKKFGDGICSRRDTTTKSKSKYSGKRLGGILTAIFVVSGLVIFFALWSTVFNNSSMSQTWELIGFLGILPGSFLLPWIIVLIVDLIIDRKNSKDFRFNQKNEKKFQRHLKKVSRVYEREIITLNQRLEMHIQKNEDQYKILLSNYSKEKQTIENAISKLEFNLKKLQSTKKSIQTNTIIPVTYLTSLEVCEKLLILLLNKRANNVTDLVNLYETEKWREKVISTLDQGFKMLYEANQQQMHILSKQLEIFKDLHACISNIASDVNALAAAKESSISETVSSSDVSVYVDTSIIESRLEAIRMQGIH